MKFNGFPPETIKFLGDLAENNNRQWFHDHRNEYEKYYLAPSLAFADVMGNKLSELIPNLQHGAKVNRSLYRINKDVRFSKDKSPYKTHIGIIFWKGPWHTKHWNPGMYFHIEAGRLLTTTGAWMMAPEMLEEYRSMLKDKKRGTRFVKIIDALNKKGLMLGSENMLKKYPRGFSKDDPLAEYAKYKSIYTEIDELGSLPDIVHTPELVDYCMAFYSNTVEFLEFFAEMAFRVDVS